MTDKKREREIRENIKYMKGAKSLQEAGITMEEALDDFEFLLKRIGELEKQLGEEVHLIAHLCEALEDGGVDSQAMLQGECYYEASKEACLVLGDYLELKKQLKEK